VTVALLRLSLVFALCGAALTSYARNWTGDGVLVGGVFKLWSDPDNWSPNGAPQNGEDLWFSAALFLDPPPMFNDLTNLTVSSLGFAITSAGDINWTLYGNTLGISGSVRNDNSFDSQVQIHCGLKLTGNALFVTGGGADGNFIEHAAMHIYGPVDLNGHNLVLQSKSDSYFQNTRGELYVEGGISGAGNVYAVADYDCSIEFKGAGSSFAGALTLNPKIGSTIVLNVTSGVVVSDRLVVTNVGTVRLDLSEQIGDAATVRLSDGATLSLNGHAESIQNLELFTDSNDSRPSVLDASSGLLGLYGNITAVCNNSSQTPAIKGKLTLPSGEHDFNISGSVYAGLDMQAQILGFGNFSKSGLSALLLTASNSCNSSISVLQGTLDVRNNHGLGDTAGTTALFGGALLLRNVAIADELLFAVGQGTGGEMPGSVLTSFGISSWSGQVVLNTNLVVNGDMTFTGPISGTGGIGCFGGGTVQLGGTLANTYTGTTLVRCPLLELNKPYQVNAFAGPLVVGGPTGGPCEARWLNWYQNPATSLTLFANGVANLNNSIDRFLDVTFNGGHIETGSGQFVLGDFFSANASHVTVNASTGPTIMNGNFQPAGGPCWLTVADGVADPDLMINSLIVGAAPQLIKQGPGTLRLTGANTYIGVTIVNEGILDAAQNAALGSANFGTIVNDPATLRLSSSDTMAEGLALNGTGVGGTNGVLHVTGNPTLTGGIFLNAPSTINIAQSGGLAVDSVISGAGPLIKIGLGNLFLGGVTGGAGNNTYTGGTVVNAGPLYLSKNQNVIAAPGNLTIGPSTAGSPAVARWVHSGMMSASSTVTVNVLSLLDLNGNGQILTRLNLNDGGDAQTGAGVLSFAGGGVVAIDTLNPSDIGLRGSASISGNIELPHFDTVTFTIARYSENSIFTTTPELDVPANIFGNGDIHKNGAGQMRLRGNNSFNDSPPTSAGNVQVLGGTLIAASATALGGTGGVTFVDTAGTLALDGGITITGEPLSLFSTNAPGLLNLSGANTWAGDIRFFRDSTIGANPGGSLLINGVIFGTGSLTKINAGTLTLGGGPNNTYSGDTFVNDGTLVLDKAALVGAISIPHHVTVGGPAGSAATLIGKDENGINGSVTVNSGGVWSLIAGESFSELELQGHQALTLNGNAQVQMVTASLILPPGGGVTVNPGSNTTATISGGAIGLYDFSGALAPHPFSVSAGTSQFGNPECVVNTPIEQVLGVFRIQKEGAGTLRLTGTNTYSGTNLVNGGTLWVDGVQLQSPVHLNTGTRLKGSGTVGHINLVGSSAIIAPGSSPGILTCSNFNAIALGSGTLEVELNAHTPIGYDQINVRGTVNLTGLTLAASLNFASAVGQNFTLINNDGADAVTGTFTGLPQNAKLYIGGEPFQINYSGGSGNDVMLTRLLTQTRPLLTIEHVPPDSVRLFWATNDQPFSLQSVTNLGATNWVTVLPPPVVQGTNHVVTNTISGAQRFYRLSNP
jgi:autotransporter-associated beta strand protein